MVQPIPGHESGIVTLKEGDEVRVNDEAILAPDAIRWRDWHHNQNRSFPVNGYTSLGVDCRGRSLSAIGQTAPGN